jgi:hypothetical protein
LVGSGVLLRVKQQLFLLSAAHVLQEFNDTAIVTPANEEFIGLVGDSYRSALPSSGSHENDKIDAAVLQIQSNGDPSLEGSAGEMEEAIRASFEA